ncbi:MAG: response regulator [Simplicispira sp.]|nr:response regulator [Simplicispira sp.]
MPASHSLLVVDDDPLTCTRVKAYFEREGYGVRVAAHGDEMWACLHQHPIDVVLLDIGLPGRDGLELARELRAHNASIGLILVTGRNDEIDKIVGLESGADDYVTKPFNARELLARVKIVLRRLRPVSAAGASGLQRKLGPWTLDLAQRKLTAENGRPEILTRGEFDLLAALARHPGTAVERERLMQQVFHRAWDPSDRTVDVLVARLREKMEKDPRHPELIVTVRGIGYLLADNAAS